MIKLIFLISCMVVFSNISAQDKESFISRFIPNTVDIRSIGMGKTEAATYSGSNALFTNPSLLSLQENKSIRMGSVLHLGFAKDEFFDEISNANDTNIEYGYKPNFKFSHISFSLPFHFQFPSVPLSFAFGIGYQNAIDLSFTQYQNEEQQTENEKFYNNTITRYTGGLNTITPGFAFGLLDQISVGISFNIGFGDIKSKTTSEYKTPGGKEETDFIVTAAGKAFYPTIGISGKPLQNMTIGLSFSTSYDWEWDDMESEKKTDEEDKEDTFYGAEFTMPPIFSVGLEYQITPKFSIAAEYQSRPLASFKSDNFYKDNLSFDDYIDSIDLKNGHVLHLGAELIAGKVPLRLGFFTEPYAITDNGLNSSGNFRYDENPNYLIGGTLGLGIPIRENALIDVAAQYGRLKTTKEIFNIITNKKNRYDEIQHLIRVDLGITIDLPSINIKKAASTVSPGSARSNILYNHM